MNAFLFYFFHHILLFNLLPLLLHAKLFNGTPAEFLPINSQIYGMKEMPIPNHQQLLGMDNEGKTLADQIMQQMEKSSDGKKENPWTKLLKNEGIEEKDFYEILGEMREKEQMIGIVFGGEIHQNGQLTQQLQSEKALKKKLNKENMEEIRKLKAIKENDREMSQIMLEYLTFTDELKNTGKVSQAMKEYLLMCSEIFAKRLNIPLTKISETKILAKLVKIVLEKKRQNDKEKNGQNDKQKNGQNDKQKKEEMLRLLYTAAETINIPGDIATKDKTTKSKRRRRKRDGDGQMTLIFLGCLAVIALITLLCWWRSRNSATALKIDECSTLEVYHKNNEMNDEAQEQCSVCLAHFKEGENIRKTTCSHIFHPQCIQKWFKSHTTCPVCRRDYQISTQSAPSNLELRPPV